jgi:hypothetical protein
MSQRDPALYGEPGEWLKIKEKRMREAAGNNLPSGPSVGQMAKNFVVAMTESAKTGFKKVTPEQHAQRMAVCNNCQFWDGKARMGAGKCLKCGCSGAKQWLASSKCPINLWGSIA